MNYYARDHRKDEIYNEDGHMIRCSTEKEAKENAKGQQTIFALKGKITKKRKYEKLYYWHRVSILDVQSPSPAKPKQTLINYAKHRDVDPADLEIRLPHEHGGSPNDAWVGINAPVFKIDPE